MAGYSGNVFDAVEGLIRRIGIQLTIPFRWTGFMSNFKYFSDTEIAGLQTPLPAMLDMARGISGVPFRLTATVATDGHAPNSTHYKGLAVDIGLGHLDEGAIRDRARFLIVKGLYGAGFQRIEVCPEHIHADIGTLPDYATPILWLGTDS